MENNRKVKVVTEIIEYDDNYRGVLARSEALMDEANPQLARSLIVIPTGSERPKVKLPAILEGKNIKEWRSLAGYLKNARDEARDSARWVFQENKKLREENNRLRTEKDKHDACWEKCQLRAERDGLRDKLSLANTRRANERAAFDRETARLQEELAALKKEREDPPGPIPGYGLGTWKEYAQWLRKELNYTLLRLNKAEEKISNLVENSEKIVAASKDLLCSKKWSGFSSGGSGDGSFNKLWNGYSGNIGPGSCD